MPAVPPKLPSIWNGGGQQVFEERIGVVAVEEACPVVEFPAHAPAGGGIAAFAERLTGSVSQ